MTAQNYLLGRLGISEPLAGGLFDEITIAQALDVMRRLGGAALYGKRDEVRISIGQIDKDLSLSQPPQAVGALLQSGFEYGRGGKETMHRLMSSMISSQEALYGGPRAILGAKFVNWAVHRHNPVRDTVLDALDDLVRANCKGLRRARRVNSEVALPHLEKHLHWLELDRYSAQTGVELPETATRKMAIKTVGDSDVLLSKSAARTYLDIPTQDFLGLIENGLIVPAWQTDFELAIYFYRSELDALIERLLSKLISTKDPGVVPYFAMFRKNAKVLTAVHMRRVLRGIPRGVRRLRGAGGLREIGVHRQQGTRPTVFEQLRTQRDDVIDMLGISPADVDGLVGGGHLGLLKNCAETFDPVALYDLRCSHLSARDVAAACSWRGDLEPIEDLLLRSKIQPLVSACTSPLYPRYDAIRALYKALPALKG